MGGPMTTYGYVSFLAKDTKRADQIRDYFVNTVAKAMRLRYWSWYDKDGEELGWGYQLLDDIQHPSTRMMIVFAADDPEDEVDLSPAATLLNEKFRNSDAQYFLGGTEW